MSFRRTYPDANFGEYTLSANKKNIDLQYVYNLLCTPSRYSTGLPAERFPFIIKNSVCFGVFYQGKQVGFSRVITDYSEFASLWDVFIDDEHRGKGVGKALMKYLFSHYSLQGIFRWFLMTEDAHGLYQKYGFKTEAYNPYVMMKVNSG
ncbi:MAG TPA: GNAT family N-acetyltransferase [Gammaproteobacteria bacterium]|jgi:GNAT superfamily N-acetyltransferase|nr:GNAT family N-acetyltransferase [Gammaproteobacteria bacterium]